MAMKCRFDAHPTLRPGGAGSGRRGPACGASAALLVPGAADAREGAGQLRRGGLVEPLRRAHGAGTEAFDRRPLDGEHDAVAAVGVDDDEHGLLEAAPDARDVPVVIAV